MPSKWLTSDPGDKLMQNLAYAKVTETTKPNSVFSVTSAWATLPNVCASTCSPSRTISYKRMHNGIRGAEVGADKPSERSLF
jgi:hypothetical protein